VIDINSESLVTLTEGAKILPNRPHSSTLWRWHKIGVRGERLETCMCGGKRYTSKEALQRFVDRITEAHDRGGAAPTKPIHETMRQRRAAIENAERELEAAGI
jgi:hypothetical protein